MDSSVKMEPIGAETPPAVPLSGKVFGLLGRLFGMLVKLLALILIKVLGAIEAVIGKVYGLLPLRVRDRFESIQFVTFLALGFAYFSYTHPFITMLFWLSTALAVELGVWDDMKTRFGASLTGQGQVGLSGEWAKFSSKVSAGKKD